MSFFDDHASEFQRMRFHLKSLYHHPDGNARWLPLCLIVAICNVVDVQRVVNAALGGQCVTN